MIFQWIALGIILFIAVFFFVKYIKNSVSGKNKCSCCTKDCPLKQSLAARR